MGATLGELIRPCGPVVDPAAAQRSLERIVEGAADWVDWLQSAWPALAPAFAASPYLAGLATRAQDRLRRLLMESAEASLAAILNGVETCARDNEMADADTSLRILKGDLHLLTALADLGGVWDLETVTSALTAFADAAVRAALRQAAKEATAGGLLNPAEEKAQEGPVPGFFVIGMGKLGAFELNYSSDVDLIVFYEPDAIPKAKGASPEKVAIRIVERMVQTMQARTADGYVFRVDLRLRPDPSSTRVAVPTPEAFNYYESVGQNWERAAFIKARVIAGDMARGEAFLTDLKPFVWRRNLDFAAIADIHSIKRQIHVHKVDDRLTAAGADLKLGRGGIREIEFFAQTQQLILGGRHPTLRSPRTLETLAALAREHQVDPQDAANLAAAYSTLRSLEHRVQMISDEQTHRLPVAAADRRRIAALAGYSDLRRFDSDVSKTLRGVNRTYGALFAGEEPLSSRHGSLIFTGVDDDPETLQTLKKMGFAEPKDVSSDIRAWHHGHIGPTRTERGRELLTRLAPRLLEAAAATGAADAAFNRFADFFSRLTSGIQVQSLFLAQPNLLALVVRIMAFAPRFATTLARHPAALDALLDPGFFAAIEPPTDLARRLAEAGTFEVAMDLARRARREQAFRVAVQVLEGAATAEAAGAAFADLADAIIAGLAAAALAEVQRTFGAFDGDVAVIALGKCGAREMTAQSDLDLMTLYRARQSDAVSETSGLSADTFYARFTQRLVAALSVYTAEGGLYEVDLQLRPSGTKGPVAVSLAAFDGYYEADAETWELLALTRARLVWSTSESFAETARQAIGSALRRPREAVGTGRDVADMRALMARERPPAGFWDMKLSDGGLVDIEFAVQHLQLVHSAEGGPMAANTGEALAAFAETDLVDPGLLSDLKAAWTLQQALSQLLKIALEDDHDPETEPKALRMLLAKAGGARDFRSLKSRLTACRARALAASRAVISG